MLEALKEEIQMDSSSFNKTKKESLVYTFVVWGSSLCVFIVCVYSFASGFEQDLQLYPRI